MKFASVRLIAADIHAMVAFYELVTGRTADWLAPQFAEIGTPAATLAKVRNSFCGQRMSAESLPTRLHEKILE